MEIIPQIHSTHLNLQCRPVAISINYNPNIPSLQPLAEGEEIELKRTSQIKMYAAPIVTTHTSSLLFGIRFVAFYHALKFDPCTVTVVKLLCMATVKRLKRLERRGMSVSRSGAE